MAVKKTYRINLRNYGSPPAVMVSQYDEGYAIAFEIFDGPLPVLASSLSGYTFKLKGRQPGNPPFLAYEFEGTLATALNAVVSFEIDTTMTGRAGKGTAELVILDEENDVKFASVNFAVYTEPAAVPDGSIDADVERAQEIADEVAEIVDGATEGAEAWAVGQRGGVDVESTDPTYHNNAKYYAESISGVTDQVATNTSDISDLKEDLSDLASSGYLKVIDLQKVDGEYISTNGNIVTYTGMCYAVLPVSVGDILVLTTNPSGNINAISYSATETLSTPLERVMLGTGNTVQTYTWNVDKTGYAVVSGTTESVSVKIYRKQLRNQTEYDIYIAGSNSAHKAEADFVCTGENDDEIINKALTIPSVKSVYFYSDSIFSLSAPIVLGSGQTVKSNGAVFTQPAMVTTKLTSANTDVTSHLLRVSSVQGFKAGQYVYIEDDNGQNMSNIIASVYSAGNPSITFVNQIDYQWTPEYNTVIKTASPCFVINHSNTVTIDGVHIDWNVSENPIQTYNPYFLQEGVSVQYSNNVTIKNCKIENGGRRGICTTDSKDIIIKKCFIKNWHEHAIDIFSGYTDLENPALSNVIITDNIVTDNKMHGIQLHRGSGVIVDNCIAYNNVEANISMAEYAHHNVVSNCLCDTSKVGIVVRTGCHDNLVIGNQVLNCSINGVWIRGTSTLNTKNNRIDGNLIDGTVRCGILAEFADRSSIANNKMRRISSDMENGVPIQVSLSHYSVIKSNEIERSEVHALYGIRVAGGTSDYNIINDNVIYNCGAPSYTGQHDVATGNIVMNIA